MNQLDLTKQACFNTFISKGLDFEDALEKVAQVMDPNSLSDEDLDSNEISS
jgi:hypothetical protein